MSGVFNTDESYLLRTMRCRKFLTLKKNKLVFNFYGITFLWFKS